MSAGWRLSSILAAVSVAAYHGVSTHHLIDGSWLLHRRRVTAAIIGIRLSWLSAAVVRGVTAEASANRCCWPAGYSSSKIFNVGVIW